MRPAAPLSSMTPHGLLRRRAVVAVLVGAPSLCMDALAQPFQGRRATPAQTEGPFYPVVFPKDADYDLLKNGALNYPEGQRVWLAGRVSDLAGRPVAGAQVEIWQCDHAGHYHHPGDGGAADSRFQGFGRVTVAADGGYRFHTIRPVAYSGRTPHIHIKVRLGSRELLTTQVYVAGDPGNPRDFLWRSLSVADRAALTVTFAPEGDGLRAVFPIVVAA
ncbi:intradiol ring-cleavage dioxygenase [Propionivibrio sp.]|uniref:dioxygenase family protein n=1 Tax=Propionivibrio sp. TaxID=2212460 RepID=UPI0039E68FF5